jgi:DNA-binding IclR family transcriptional regulator
LARSPGGATTGEVARFLGKSSYTAYYLLNSLRQEGFAYRGRGGRYSVNTFPGGLGTPTIRSPLPSLDVLHEALEELNVVTGCRAYLVVYDGRVMLLEAVRGRQGQLGVKGVGEEIRAEAHALAVGKAILAQLPEAALRSYIQCVGLRRFTPRTITDPAEFRAELSRVRQESVAFDREEHAESIYCIAAPVSAVDRGQELLASLGIVVPRGRFKTQGSRLVKMVYEVTSHIGTVGRHEGTANGGGRSGGSGVQSPGSPTRDPLGG